MYILEKYINIKIREAFSRSLNLFDRKKVSEFMNSIFPSDENINDCPISYTSEEALALIEEADSSESQYHMIYMQVKKRSVDIYPAYQVEE